MGKRKHGKNKNRGHWGHEAAPSAPNAPSEAHALEDALIEEVWSSGDAEPAAPAFSGEDDAWPDGSDAAEPGSAAAALNADVERLAEGVAAVADETAASNEPDAQGDEQAAPPDASPNVAVEAEDGAEEPEEALSAREVDPQPVVAEPANPSDPEPDANIVADAGNLAAAMDAAEAGKRKRKGKRAKRREGDEDAAASQAADPQGTPPDGADEALPDNVLELFGADAGDGSEADEGETARRGLDAGVDGGTEEGSEQEAEADGEPDVDDGLERLEGARLESVIESLLFATDRLLNLADLRRLTSVRDTRKIQKALDDLKDRRMDTGIILVEAAGSYRFQTNPLNADWVGRMVQGKPVRLSRAMMETLAIVAYKQPITRPEVDDIRGVDCGPVLKTLLERNLVRVIGKKEEVGRPLLYGTTPDFLKTFNLSDLTELPTLREFHELGAEESQKMKQTFPQGEGPARASAEGREADAAEPAPTEQPPAPGVRAPGLMGDRPSAFSNKTVADVPEDESLIEELERATEAATRALDKGKGEPEPPAPQND